MKINELEQGKVQEIEVLVKEIHNGNCKNGDPYQKMSVLDKDGGEGYFYKFGQLAEVKANDVILAKVETGTYRESTSFRICECKKVQGADPKDFFPKSQIDPKAAWAEINKYLKMFSRPGLKKLVVAVLEDNKRAFINKPLHAAGSFCRTNGILESTLKLLQLSVPAADVLGLSKDFLIAGGLLYYIGNTELIGDNFLPTEDDVLIGDSLASVKKVITAEARLRAAEKDPLTEEMLSQSEVKMLCHILSSRNYRDNTAIPECYVLKYNDRIVQKTDEAKTALQGAVQGETVYASQKYYKG